MRCRLRRLLEAAAITLLALLVTSREANAQFTRFQNYNEEQGLGTLAVTSFAQDRAGAILFGTEGGLYAYDGTRVTPYTAPGLPSAPSVEQVAFDADDRLWVMTADGAFARDGAVFRPIVTGQRSLEDQSYHLLALSRDRAVLDAGGALLSVPVGPSGIGTPSPLFDAIMRRKVPELAKAHFVVSDGSDGLLIGCGHVLCVSSHHQVTTLGREVGLPDDDWLMALSAPEGVLWVRSLGHLAWRSPGQASFHVVEVPGHSRSYFAGHTGELDLVPDGRGGVLTEGNGDLLEFTGGSWKDFGRHAGGLPANTVHGLFIDHEGSLWVGSEGAGAFRSLGLGKWEHWTADDGLPSNTIWSMTRLPNGQFWVATDQGTVSLGNKHGTVPGSNYALAGSRNGRLWLAPFGGSLQRLDAQGQTMDSLAFAPTVLMGMVDRNDRLWLGTRDGLYLIADADAAIADIRPRLVLPDAKMEIVTDPSGGIWAVGSSGVFRFGRDGAFRLLVSPAALGSRAVDLAFAPDGTIWVGTRGKGVQRFGMQAGRMLPLSGLRPPTIASDSILFLHRDRSDRLWVGSDHGIDMFDGRSWRRFDSSEGAISNDLDQASVFEDKDGSMWFGTGHGLSHLLTPNHLPPPATLHPRVVSVTLGGRTLTLSSRMTARWSAAPLIIRFDDLDYDQGAISFRYRLRGLDGGWSDTVAREVRYADVPVGKYSFELLAVSSAQGVLSAPIHITIRISAPWWRRWWFFALCSALITLFLVGAWQARIRILLQRQRRLEEVVRLRTAEIEQARRELEHRSLLEQGRLQSEQRRLEEMVEIRTSEIEQARSEMQRTAMSDVLTGLANRRAIMKALEDAVASAMQSGEPLAILLCDIDYFKKINDEFGHLAGDAVLTEFGGRLASIIALPEAAGRYGGEEFLVILPGDREATMRRVLDVQAVASQLPYIVAGEHRRVTFSGGVAILRLDDTPVTIIARADTALYTAKKNGRSRIVFEDTLETCCHESDDGLIGPCPSIQASGAPDDGATILALFQGRRSLELELREALHRGQLLLHYQPVVDLDTDAVTSCEALLRWHSPSRGEMVPSEFIPIAEQLGLMPEIGDWVLRTACREARTWQDSIKVSVNLSPTQLRLPDLVSRISTVIAETGLPPSRLELELTEMTMIGDMTTATTMLRELRALGFAIALDDFGTGYSSLSFLLTLPFDRLKIDRSFVQDLGVRPEALAIVRAVAGLCSSIGTGLTAEGAETDRQIDLLREAGCSEIQGFRICRPGPAVDLRAWMTAFATSRRHVSAR